MKKHHGRPPAGYINVDGHLEPDPDRPGSCYRQVVDCYLETGSSTAARRLRHELIGKPWGASAFARWILAENLRGAVVPRFTIREAVDLLGATRADAQRLGVGSDSIHPRQEQN